MLRYSHKTNKQHVCSSHEKAGLWRDPLMLKTYQCVIKNKNNWEWTAGAILRDPMKQKYLQRERLATRIPDGGTNRTRNDTIRTPAWIQLGFFISKTLFSMWLQTEIKKKNKTQARHDTITRASCNICLCLNYTRRTLLFTTIFTEISNKRRLIRPEQWHFRLQHLK